MVDSEMQTLSVGPLATVFEYDGELRKEKEIITYSKGVQTSTDWSPPRARAAGGSDTERDDSPTRSPRAKRLSRRQKERDEEIRASLKKEIEEELKAAQQAGLDVSNIQTGSKENFPFKTLTNEELTAVENSDDFVGFVERSTKVLERALDQQLGYDILANYAVGGIDVDQEDEGYGSSGAKKGRRIKEVAQFWDERWSKKRMISDLGFSTKV
jgi:dynein intermediate chain